VVAWGYNAFNQGTVPAGLSNVTAVASGRYHNLVLKRDGTVTAWGYNAEGQAAVPANLGHTVAVAAGGNYSLAVPLMSNAHFPEIVGLAHHDGSVAVSVRTAMGPLYALELTDSLAPPRWQAVGPRLPGNGSTRVLTDSLVDAPRRYYRIRQW